MKIGIIEQQPFDILPSQIKAKLQVEKQVAVENKEAVVAQLGMSLDFSKLGEAHKLDEDRVASLIADPFSTDL